MRIRRFVSAKGENRKKWSVMGAVTPPGDLAGLTRAERLAAGERGLLRAMEDQHRIHAQNMSILYTILNPRREVPERKV